MPAEKWVTAAHAAKRRILDIVCLNFSLKDVSLNLVREWRKPFDVLVGGLSVCSHSFRNPQGGCSALADAIQLDANILGSVGPEMAFAGARHGRKHRNLPLHVINAKVSTDTIV